jgi:hypothetical protein
MTTNIFCFYLQNRLIQTSQTGGQWYSDTSPFSIPCAQHSLQCTMDIIYGKMPVDVQTQKLLLRTANLTHHRDISMFCHCIACTGLTSVEGQGIVF